MTTDELIKSAETLFAELRTLRNCVHYQKQDTAVLYAWLCVLAARHGSISPGWGNASAGMTLTMTGEERAIWLKARESWVSETGAGYLSGAMDISLPQFPPHESTPPPPHDPACGGSPHTSAPS